jgi:hypothetical protein
MSFQVLAPLVAGLSISALVGLALHTKITSSRTDALNQNSAKVYRSPQNLLGVIFFFAIAVPVGVFFLPDSVVMDARTLFNFSGLGAGALLLYCWVYLKRFKIILINHSLIYGAFVPRTIDLNAITRIRYHWVNNGISLKLFSGKKRVGIFEGNVENFDDFAKTVRHRIPKDAVAEAVGRASF